MQSELLSRNDSARIGAPIRLRMGQWLELSVLYEIHSILILSGIATFPAISDAI